MKSENKVKRKWRGLQLRTFDSGIPFLAYNSQQQILRTFTHIPAHLFLHNFYILDLNALKFTIHIQLIVNLFYAQAKSFSSRTSPAN